MNLRFSRYYGLGALVVLIASIAGAFFAWQSAKFFQPEPTFKTIEDKIQWSMKHSSADAVFFNPDSATNEYFRVITDTNAGEYAVVTHNKRVVALKNENGKTIWSVNLFDQCRGMADINFFPCDNGREIWMMVMAPSHELEVRMCKNVFYIHPKTGAVRYWGAD